VYVYFQYFDYMYMLSVFCDNL